MSKFLIIIFFLLNFGCSHVYKINYIVDQNGANTKLNFNSVCFKRGFDLSTSQPLDEKDLIFGDLIKEFFKKNSQFKTSCNTTQSLYIILSENRIFDSGNWYDNLYPLIRISKFTYNIIYVLNSSTIGNASIDGNKITSILIFPYFAKNQNDLLLTKINQYLNINK